MISITLDNNYVYIRNVPGPIFHQMREKTSYYVSGYEHTTAYQEGRWDGKKYLIAYNKSEKVFKAPAGLAEKIISIIEENGAEWQLTDLRIYPKRSLKLKQVTGLRPYQQEALELATEPYGYSKSVGRGIIKISPRGGKTLIATAIVAKLGVRTLFIVPSQLLLYQSQKALSKALEIEIGILGDGVWEPSDITVSTAQTLLAKRGTPEYRDIIENTDLLIVDEIHHFSSGDAWRNILLDCKAPYKIGLSATVFLENSNEEELGVIWLRACAGDILIDISVSELIRLGYLVKPKFLIIPIREPDLSDEWWSQQLPKAAIWGNPIRNRIIADITEKLIKTENRKVVIVSNRLEQVDTLFKMMNSSISCERIVGATPAPKRAEIIEGFRKGHISTLIGTVLSEGVDIPEIDCVINAEGGKNIKTTYQRLRCLTLCEGKKDAVFVDFADMTHSYFAQHSKDRLSVYRSEKEFDIEILDNYA